MAHGHVTAGSGHRVRTHPALLLGIGRDVGVAYWASERASAWTRTSVRPREA